MLQKNKKNGKKIPVENQIEFYPKDYFYNVLLSSYNEEVYESKDNTEVQSILFDWKEKKKNNSYNITKENIEKVKYIFFVSVLILLFKIVCEFEFF